MPEKSPAALADAVLGLIRSPGMLERLSSEAARSVAAKYGWDACLRALEDCYEEAIGRA